MVPGVVNKGLPDGTRDNGRVVVGHRSMELGHSQKMLIGTGAQESSPPWSMELNVHRPVPRGSCKRLTESRPCWRSSIISRFDMTTNDETSLSGVCWDRWVHKLHEMATDHVGEAYHRLQKHLDNATKCSRFTDVRSVLVLAGSDVADHGATMRQVEQLIRVGSPDMTVALVGPEDFINMAAVMKCVCRQLIAGESKCTASAFDDPDCEDAEEGKLCRAGVPDLVNWCRDRTKQGIRTAVVIVVEQANTVSKELLRSMLGCFGSLCRGEDIPMFVVFGLQRPPLSRFDLLGGDLFVSLNFVDAFCLFDADAVCDSFLEWLARDWECPLALSPTVLEELKDSFKNTHSMSHVMRALRLLCHEYSERHLCKSCAPLFGAEKKLKETVGELFASMTVQETSVPKAEVQKVAKEAIFWRKHLSDALVPWELLCNAQPLSIHEAPLRRILPILHQLWPREGGNADQENDCFEHVLEGALENIKQENTTKSKLLNLLQELDMVKSLAMDALDQLHCLKKYRNNVTELSNGLVEWFHGLRRSHWRPLRGKARTFFLEVFAWSNFTGIKRYLGCDESTNIATTIQLPLARGLDSRTPNDMTLLYRLLECNSERSFEVKKLWEVFSSFLSKTTGCEGAVGSPKDRFGHALLGLHRLGLFTYRATTDGYDLRKRVFGRVFVGCDRHPEFSSVVETSRAEVFEPPATDVFKIHQVPGSGVHKKIEEVSLLVPQIPRKCAYTGPQIFAPGVGLQASLTMSRQLRGTFSDNLENGAKRRQAPVEFGKSRLKRVRVIMT